MSSVTSAISGVADLLQTFENTGSSAVSSPLSSSAVQSALQQASPADILQLSEQALRLQQVGGLFGTSSTAATPTPAHQTPAEQEASDLFGSSPALPGTSDAGNSTISLLG
jgi:hypothetical protein